MRNKKIDKRLFTFPALQRVGVTAIVVDIIEKEDRAAVSSAAASVTADSTPQPTPTPEPDQIVIRSYLLALNPQDALVLKHLIDAGGKFDFVLRDPTSTELFNLSPVLQEFLEDRYQLKVKE